MADQEAPAAPPPIADLPSGEPVPPAPTTTTTTPTTPPPPASHADTPVPGPGKPPPAAAAGGGPPALRALLAAAPSRADAFLAHLHRCFQTPAGADTVLLLVCYGSRLGAAVLARLAASLLRRSARELVALAFALPPRATILFSASAAAGPGRGAAGAAPAPAELAALLAARLRALAGLASEARMITRIWSLLGMYFWGKAVLAQLRRSLAPAPAAAAGEKEGAATAVATTTATTTTTPAGRLAAAVDGAQFLACVALQALESGAYLSSRGVLGWSPARQARAFRLSSRFWAVYVGLSLGKLLAEKAVASREEEAGAARTPEQEAAWRKLLARNLAWAPLTVHWSMEKGFVSDGFVGLLGSIPGVIQMRDLWRDTAQ